MAPTGPKQGKLFHSPRQLSSHGRWWFSDILGRHPLELLWRHTLPSWDSQKPTQACADWEGLLTGNHRTPEEEEDQASPMAKREMHYPTGSEVFWGVAKTRKNHTWDPTGMIWFWLIYFPSRNTIDTNGQREGVARQAPSLPPSTVPVCGPLLPAGQRIGILEGLGRINNQYLISEGRKIRNTCIPPCLVVCNLTLN